MSILDDYFKRQLYKKSNQVKNKVKKKIIKKFFKPLLPYIIGIVAVIILFSLLMTAVQGFMSDNIIDDRLSSEQNKTLKSQLINIVEDINNEDTYTESGQRIGDLVDYYGNDDNLKLNWVYIQGYLKYMEISESKDYDKITTSNGSKDDTIRSIKKLAQDLKPRFIYKIENIIEKRDWDEVTYTTETVVGKDGIKTVKSVPKTIHHHEEKNTKIYVLTHAETIKGTYDITYTTETNTTTEGDVTITTTKPEINEFKQTDKDYDRLKQIIISKNPSEDAASAVSFIVNLSENYLNNSDDMEWAFTDITGIESDSYINSSIIPANLLSFFKKAEQKYKIPYWFAGAVSFRESSFNVKALNEKSGCYGLMQLTPSNWDRVSKMLGYDPVADKDNPEAQIMSGVYLLSTYIGNIKWDANWKEETLPGLTFYGGYGKNRESCRDNYAKIIWQYAENFKNIEDIGYSASWPVVGSTRVTSPFGMRVHPVSGVYKLHTGVDIAASSGTRIVSAINGTVVHSGYKGAYGIAVIVQNGNTQTYYCHLKEAKVSVGQQVVVGQLVGLADSTGASTGNHLHFEVRINKQPIDPIPWLNQHK